MKNILFILIVFVGQFVFATDIRIKHKVESHETAWFLSQVFYGNGKYYPELLKANGMTSPDQLKYGKEIEILNPKFHPDQEGFSDRYQSLLQDRSERLYHHHVTAEEKPKAKESLGRKIASEISKSVKTVEVPSKAVRQAHPKTELPFTPIHNPEKSAADEAREELEKY